jgi:DNA-binding NtrC family response regulator
MAAVIDRAVLLGQGQTLEVAAALGQGRSTSVPASAHAAGPARADGIEPLDVVMRRHIENTLEATRGRVEGPHGAARLLRINPHTLRARMRKLKIDWRRFRQAAPPG